MSATVDPARCRELAAKLVWEPGHVNAALQLTAAAYLAEQHERQGKRIADMIAAIRALATSDMPAGELRRSLLELIGE